MSDLDISNEWPNRFAEKVDVAPAWELPQALEENLRTLLSGRWPGGTDADADQTDNMVYLLAKYAMRLSDRLDEALVRIAVLEGAPNV